MPPFPAPSSPSTPGQAPGTSQLEPVQGRAFLFLWTSFGVLLYGLTLHQAYGYARTFRSDARYIKVLVIVVMLLQSAHTVLTIHICYHYLVVNYLNPSAIVQSVWSTNTLPAVSGVLMFASQTFFAYRVSLIGPHYRFVAGLTMLLLFGEVGFAIATSVMAFMMEDGKIAPDLPTFNILAAGSLFLAAIGDALLTMAVTLAIQRSRSKRSRTERESPFDWFQLFFINTGLVTSIFNFISFVVDVAARGGIGGDTINFVTARLYGICLLTVLMSREIKLAGMEVFADETSPIILAAAKRLASKEIWNAPQLPGEGEQKMIAVNVMTETEGDEYLKRRLGHV